MDNVIMGCAWYRPEQYALLLACSTDSDDLDETYEGWAQNAEHGIDEYRKKGMRVVKIDINVEKLIDWSKANGKAIDGATRAEYTSYLMTQQSYK